MPDQKVLLITGGSGYLGRHLTATAEKDFTVHTTYHAGSAQVIAGIPHKLDITDEVAVAKLIARLTPDAIIHTAAANPGRRPEATIMVVNRNGSQNIAAAAAKLGARLVHVSTDAVHSGNNAPYADDAPPSPVNPYGQSKAAAEAAVIQAKPNAAIVRTSLIYGLQEMDRGTAGFAQRLQRGESLALFHDVIRQPVWVNTLVEALLKLALDRSDFVGTLNIAGRQILSREAFGRRMLAWWDIGYESMISSASAAEMGVKTPLDLRLDIEGGEALLQMPFPGVDEVLNL